MSVFRQRGRKTWQVRLWVREEGRVKSVSTGTTDKVQAEALAAVMRAGRQDTADKARVATMLEAVMGATARPHAVHGIALTVAWEIYLALPDVVLSPQQTQIKHAHWRGFVAWLAEHRPNVQCLHQLDRQAAGEWWGNLEGTGKTRNNIKGNVGSIVQALMLRAGIAENPFRLLRQANGGDSVKGRAFTDAEIYRLLAVAPEPYRSAIVVALYTGLRFRDVAFLDWSQIGDGAIRVKPHKTARHDIGVLIPLHPVLDALLREKTRGTGHVFPELAAGYRGREQRGRFAALLAAAGITAAGGEYVSFHSLRHTFYTRLLRAGADPDIARRLGGWTQVRTADRYDHDVERLKRAVALLS